MPRRSILVVDDELDICDLYRNEIIAHSSDYSVIVAYDGSDALNKIELQNFDCIVTDLKMPKTDGKDFIDLVKASHINGTTPVIITTGYPDEKILAKHDYVWMLQKPVALKQLLTLIDQQVVLGRTNKRLPSQLINATIDILLKKLSTANLHPELAAPAKRDEGTSLKGDVFVAYQIKYKGINYWFVMGFDNNFSNNLKSHNTHPEVFMNKLLKQLLAHSGLSSAMQLLSQNVIVRDKVNATSLTGYRGLTFRIHTSIGEIFFEPIAGQEFLIAQTSSSSQAA